MTIEENYTFNIITEREKLNFDIIKVMIKEFPSEEYF
jgi:hypothetical protein